MFRFTIRELVLVTLVAAMGLAWWLDRARRLGEHEQFQVENQWLKSREELWAEKSEYVKTIRRMHDEIRTVKAVCGQYLAKVTISFRRTTRFTMMFSNRITPRKLTSPLSLAERRVEISLGPT
jgi:hypothetical protein